MSEDATARQSGAKAARTAPARPTAEVSRVNELRVSGNLMTLDTGLYCVVNKPSPIADAASGLPGVRLSLPPGSASRPEMVEISTFNPDGWLTGFGDAALVRVHNGPAHLLVTIYQAPNHPEGAPNIQVVKLLESVPPRAGGAIAAAAPAMAAPALAAEAPGTAVADQPAATKQPAPQGSRSMDMVAHIQGQGDVGALLGDRLGDVGSKRWIEGFAIAPTEAVASSDIEYQAVLGRGWLSPWVEGGEFCGSRGMALPVLGLKVRLRGTAARDFDCSYSASFTDGSQVGPVPAGASCESDSLAPLESFEVNILRRGQAVAAVVAAPQTQDEPEAPATAQPAANMPTEAKALGDAKTKGEAKTKGAAKPTAAGKPAGRAAPGSRRR